MIRLSESLVLALVLVFAVASMTPLSLMTFAENYESNTTWIDYISPPSVGFSLPSGSILYDVGNFNVGFIASGCTAANMIIASSLYSVSYKTSWQNYDIVAYQAETGSNHSQNSFFGTIDLTYAPVGSQQILVTVVSDGVNFGGGSYMGAFSKTSEAVLDFTIITPPTEPVSPPVSTWIVQMVDTNVPQQNFYPIVVDSHHEPHIAYTGFGAEYASWNGFTWSTQTVDSGCVDSLVMDSNDNPHLLCQGWSGLDYVTWNGSDWATQTVASQGNSGSLALDSTMTPHIAFTNGSLLSYASWDGSNWTIQTVDTADQISSQISLAFDQNNHPYIFYECTIQDPNSYHMLENLRLATWQNSNWTIKCIANAAGFGNMVLDSRGNPHLVYDVEYPQFTGADNSTIIYDSWNGTTWDIQNVVSNITLPTCSFLGLDTHNYPSVTFTESDGTLVYASSDGQNWSLQNVDTNFSASGPCFLVLDALGNPHISYLGPLTGHDYTASTGPVIYATIIKPTPPPTPIPWPTRNPQIKVPALPLSPILIIIIITTIVLIAAYMVSKKPVKMLKT
jgi:hypothetical protein